MAKRKMLSHGWVYEDNIKKAKSRKLQVTVWPGTTLPKNEENDLKKFFKKMGAKDALVLGIISTKPGEGGQGGRHDLVTAVDMGDNVGKFSIQRLAYGISWWEDYVDNHKEIIPEVWLDMLPKSW